MTTNQKAEEQFLIEKLQRKIANLERCIADLDKTIINLKLESIAEIKAFKLMLQVNASGFTHNEKRHLTRKTTEMLDDIVKSKMKEVGFQITDDLPF